MGKLRVMLGAAASAPGAMSASSDVAHPAMIDEDSPVRAEARAHPRSPEPALASAGLTPHAGNGSSALAEFEVGLLAVGGSAVVAVRSRRPA
jgi:hypothetical protein